MSSIPKPDKKPKYNQNKPYEWVDGQWEKFMTKQKELEDEIVNLNGKIKNDMDYIRMLEGSVEDLKEELQKSKENFRRLERLQNFENKEETKKYIYESPDNGRTIYRREFGKDERVLVEGFRSGHDKWEEVPRIPKDEDSSQMELFPPNDVY
jgi:chromosome segregation ATPase